MNISLFWARLLGFYSVILAIGILCDIKVFQSLLIKMAENPVSMLIVGMFTLLFGLAIVVSHQVWKGWPILVTFVGYIVVLKGIALLFFPASINKILTFWQVKNIYFAPLPALSLGLILLICAYLVGLSEE